MKQLTIVARPTAAANEVLEIQGIEKLDPTENETLSRFMQSSYPNFSTQLGAGRPSLCVPRGTTRLLANGLRVLLEPKGIQLRCAA